MKNLIILCILIIILNSKLFCANLLTENFESLIDNRISYFMPSTTDSSEFLIEPGIDTTSIFGSENNKAFHFGLTSCANNCYNGNIYYQENHCVILRIKLEQPTYITNIGFKWIEFGGNWGSGGGIALDSSVITNDTFYYIGIYPPNNNVTDESIHEMRIYCNRIVNSTIDIFIRDISNGSQIFFDDLVIDSTSNKVITLLYPNGGEKFKQNTSNTILWSYDPSLKIKLDFSSDGGKSWLKISDTLGSSYDWLIPKIISDSCIIKITDINDTIINDVSDSLFSIYQDSIIYETREEFQVPSDGTIICFNTEKGKCYSITVSGVYSMWDRDQCFGVDGAYVYDVPNNILDVTWPKEFPNIWVGSLKHIGIGQFDRIPRYHIGFRIDGEPLNKNFDSLQHTYYIEKKSNGNPFQFQILDSIEIIYGSTRIINPDYEDNCGYLNVRIDEYPCEGEHIEPCEIQVIYSDIICHRDNMSDTLIKQPVGLQIRAKVWQTDDNTSLGKINILQELSTNPNDTDSLRRSKLHKLGVVMDGQFVCPIDSIICDENIDTVQNKIAIGLLVDKSGSMNESISTSDLTRRIVASKAALGSFISNLFGRDTVFIMTFNNSTYLLQDWTSDTSLILNAVKNISPEGGTSVYRAIINAVNKLDTLNESGFKKSLIVLSDGADNNPADFYNTDILNFVNNKNIPIYIIALGFKTTEDLAGKDKLEKIAEASNGKLFSVYDSQLLIEIFNDLSVELSKDECCGIYFRYEYVCSDDVNQEHFVRLIYAPKDTTIATTVIHYKCIYPKVFCDSIVDIADYYTDFNGNIDVFPNPLDQNGIISFRVENACQVKIVISDFLGNNLLVESMKIFSPGEYKFTIDGSRLDPGTYFASVNANGSFLTKKIIVVH